jgi:hypothetical protein
MAPADWEVAKIGTHYLMCEDRTGPVLELKWGRVKGRFSHQHSLKKLSAVSKKPLNKAVRHGLPPPSWAKALEGFETAGFSWHGTSVSGRGVVIYCSSCRNATLIQFYERQSSGRTEKNNLTCQRLLDSFRDHHVLEETIWSILDIRAVIPREFELKRYRFEAGEFEMRFAGNRRTLILYRWGPASVLLRDQSLPRFAAARLGLSNSDPLPHPTQDASCVEWRSEPHLGGWKRCWQRMARRHLFKDLRVWHLMETNRILGVWTEGAFPFDSSLLEQICMRYESF